MKAKYIISEDEKNRILGLHNDAKKILIEGYGEVSEGGMMCEDCGKVHEGSCGMSEGMMCEDCGKVHEGSCGSMYAWMKICMKMKICMRIWKKWMKLIFYYAQTGSPNPKSTTRRRWYESTRWW